MAKAIATLRALGMIVVVWTLLLGVAWLAGALPELRAAHRAEPEASAAAAAEASAVGGPASTGAESRTGVAEGPAAPSAARPGPEVVAESSPPEATPPAPPLRRFRACPGSTRVARLAAVRLFGAPSDQLVVACDGEASLVAIARPHDGAPWVPFRVARLTGSAAHPGGAAHLSDAASADVTGDGRADLVLSVVEEDGRGNTRGGALYLVPGDPLGALDEPLRLATFAAASVGSGDVDGTAGAELVAMNRADSFGRRPSEAWLFTGGGAPARRARLRAGRRGLAAALVDLDRDGHVDVVTLSDDTPAIHVHFGDGAGAFPRTQTLEAPGGRELVVADVDHDGADDLLVVGEALQLTRGGAADAAAVRTIEAPADLRSVAADDVDGDGAPDVVGISGDGVLWLRQSGDLAFERKRLFDLPLSAGTVRALVRSELDDEPGLETAVLVRVAGEDTPWDLVVLPRALDTPEPDVEETAVPLADAPLVLGIALR